nr:hypothetical protein GCM10020093_102560 [Planobispora longispora]
MLAGAAISASLLAVIEAVLTLNLAVFDKWRFWDVGALAGRDAEVVGQVAPFVVAGAVLALGLGRGLNAIALGEQTGQGLGWTWAGSASPGRRPSCCCAVRRPPPRAPSASSD